MIHKLLGCLLLVLLLHTGASAGIAKPHEPDSLLYSASTIPDSMKKDAYAVSRLDEYDLDIKSPDKAILKTHTIVTLLNSKAAGTYSYFEEDYNDYNSIHNVIITTYDAAGNEIKRFTQKDMQDQAANGDETLVGDERELYFDIPVPEYPITIEEEYEQDLSSLTDYPDWYTLNDNTSLQSGEIIVTVPKDQDIRYKLKNLTVQPKITFDKNDKTYHWNLKNMVVMQGEDGNHTTDYLPQIMLAPNKFSCYGYKGEFHSWKEFGAWSSPFFYSKDALTLPPETVEKIKAMVAGAKTDWDKINILYHYLEQNTRYVSIQLGIGGYKPFPASFVDQKKYGDCKALSNYMHAMLNVLGINSYPALVYGGTDNESGLDPSFPEDDFNHVILCIPLKNDTVWLDCTASIAKTGVLGSFTENRKALLITENGGVLVNTPVSVPGENIYDSHTIVKLNTDDGGTAETTIHYSGDIKDEFFYQLYQQNNDDQQQFLVQVLGFRQPDEMKIEKIEDSGVNNFHTLINMSFEKIPDFSAGSKLFLAPRIYQLFHSNIQSDSNRRYAFYFPFPYIKRDTTTYILPAGYTVNNLPTGTKLQFKEGSYESSYSYDPATHSVTSIVSLILKSAKIPAVDYNDMCTFFFGVNKDSNQRIVVNNPDS
jgi:transglutaminase-like putative cysteine protease